MYYDDEGYYGNYHVGTTGNAKTVTYGKGCKHWRTRVPVDTTGTLVASGHMDRPKTKPNEWQPYPDMAVYAYVGWFDDLAGVAAVGMDAPVIPLWPFIYVSWPDYGGIHIDYYRVLVETIVTALAEGKTVEVGCQGGHGRTGTLLAGVIAKVEGLKAKRAVEETRKRYCEYAIEGHKQLTMVYELLGEKPPAAPSSGPSEKCVCGHSDHLHGKTVNGPDYKKGECVSKDCPCTRFRKEQPGALKPCVCGHSKSKHRGPKRECLRCDDCQGYTEKVEKAIEQKDCACGHTKSQHNSMGLCRVCKCVKWREPETDAKTCECGHAVGIHGAWDTMFKKWVAGEGPCNYRDCKCRGYKMRGEQPPLLPQAEKEAITLPDDAKFSVVTLSPEDVTAVCLCGHYKATHCLVTEESDHECIICVCDEFDDASDYTEEEQGYWAYALPKRWKNDTK